ncbi:MAG TPA: pentapeptide repeat-containing protein [Blastocatellia bacterium]|nr:pentapeptide repeat-containing protein [Blastocatellia bacterium]
MSQLSRGDILDRVALGESLRGINLVRVNLSSMDLSRADLTEANLRMADLTAADLRDARLTGCFLSGAILNQANLAGSNLVEASLIGVLMRSADLSRADMSGADLTGASLEEAHLEGAYLVGTFLNETDLRGSNLAGAYIRMAQMAGSNLADAKLEGADLSNTDLSGVRLDGASLANANLSGAILAASSLVGCDLRGANLSGADLRACNLTGAKLREIKFADVKLDDAWAEWVDIGMGREEERASLEEVFTEIIGKPLAQVIIQGRVEDAVWAVVLAHLCEFQSTHAAHKDVRIKAIHLGVSSSALFLEAENEMSLAAYLAEFADIIGKGSIELFQKLAAIAANQNGGGADGAILQTSGPAKQTGALHAQAMTSQMPQAVAEALEDTEFWKNEKAVVILTGNRRVWFEAASSESLTLRPPHGAAVGVDLINGRFITDDVRRTRHQSK